MKKKISLLLTAILLTGTLQQISYGFVNPLKSYNLYADTHNDNSPTDNAMSEYYYTNDKGKTTEAAPPAPTQAAPTTSDGGINVEAEIPKRRNVYLRDSSRQVYGTGAGNWTKGPYFYESPSLESIKEKYRLSNFAGCLQECEAYVKEHPYDTLGFYYLAMSYAKCGDKENAILAYEQVISLNDNPMIVKYATNGRNCVMGNEEEAKCFQNVNEPDLYYPYQEMAKSIEMTPVDPQTLIDRNLTALQERLNPPQTTEGNNDENGEKKIQLPFELQDDKLDKFINAPYGTGFSPELEQQYKQMQLRNIQRSINSEDNNNEPGKYFQNIKNIKEFDSKKQTETDKKSDSETIKLALADNMDINALIQNPEYIKNKKELDELKMMFGEYNTDTTTDITSILPELAKEGENISPQVVQMMMMQSVMPNIINTENKNGF